MTYAAACFEAGRCLRGDCAERHVTCAVRRQAGRERAVGARVSRYLRSGIVAALARGETVRWLRVTYPGADVRKVRDAWNELSRRVRRQYGRYEFCGVLAHSPKGLPHIHAVFVGPYIPQRWLSDEWGSISGFPVVWVSLVQTKGVAGYIHRNAVAYVAGQGGSARLVMSDGWL